MNRVQKNAEGEDVRVDTPAFGCITIDPAAAEPTPKPKARLTDGALKAIEEGTAK